MSRVDLAEQVGAQPQRMISFSGLQPHRVPRYGLRVPRPCSSALQRWKSDRWKALDSLESAHTAVTGGRRGRQYATEHLNLALFVSLAAEFQGFCRDLHDEAAEAIASQVGPPGDATVVLFQSALTRARNLDKGNAQPGGLGNDFYILDIPLWADLEVRYPTRKKQWHTTLTSLNSARNAIAHRNDDQLAKVKLQQPLNLATFRKWRSSLNGAASGFDYVVGAYLKDSATVGWHA
ncbi:hypothetical protein ABZV91_24540 [Nocardia sp. NPDC004568]|uniref:hypothetical protein n=1 Tax=Nocardia sp. NPDC004568 TaxID=3154551 RepID=UPI0033B4BB6A